MTTTARKSEPWTPIGPGGAHRGRAVSGPTHADILMRGRGGDDVGVGEVQGGDYACRVPAAEAVQG